MGAGRAGKRRARSFALLFGPVPSTWSVEEHASWMPIKVSPGERLGTLGPQWASRPKTLPLPLTVKQTEAQRGEETCSRSPSQKVAKLVTVSPRLTGCQSPIRYLQSSHLQPGLLDAAVTTCQKGCPGSANVTQPGRGRAGTPPCRNRSQEFTRHLSPPCDLFIEPTVD